MKRTLDGAAATLAEPADVAELVDAHGSGPCGRKPVEVQVLSSASPNQAARVPNPYRNEEGAAWLGRSFGVRETESSPDRDTVSAAVVDLERDGQERRIVIELAGTADSVGQTLNARDAVSAFLNEDEPPKRLIITTHGVSPAE